MKDRKLSKNFKLSEFANLNEELTDYQIALLTNLAEELEYVRERLQQYKSGMKPVYMVVTSGVRTKADITRLKKQGYNPSENSDHLCGVQANGKPTLGAADIQFYNCSLTTKQIALEVKEMVNNNAAFFGQVIYEKNPKTGAEWIHFGNDPEQIFSYPISASAARKKFLMSVDNGKTYKALK